MIRRVIPAVLRLTLAAVVLLPAAATQAAFSPPVIIKVVPSGQVRTYYIDRGLDANIKVGDVLNVFREVEMSLGRGEMQTLRIQLGTMAITASEQGIALGRFIADESIRNNPLLRMKNPVLNDLVIPKLKIDSSVLFQPGAATLQGQVVQEELDKIAKFVRSFSPSKLIVEGHTDSDGDVDANQTLSVARAEMIKDFLINNYEEITAAMVSARGFGETRPIVPNNSTENRALNRRIEIVVWE